ncbi:MAG: hypothetical protein M1825_005071 [Sarcosagium campestre]|nr:MAG: hypothetical protein M1825_005071 [Sarcosagium campestre]
MIARRTSSWATAQSTLSGVARYLPSNASPTPPPASNVGDLVDDNGTPNDTEKTSFKKFIDDNWLGVVLAIPGIALAIIFGVYGVLSYEMTKKAYDQDSKSYHLSLLDFCLSHEDLKKSVICRSTEGAEAMASTVVAAVRTVKRSVHDTSTRMGQSFDGAMNRRRNEFYMVLNYISPFFMCLVYEGSLMLATPIDPFTISPYFDRFLNLKSFRSRPKLRTSLNYAAYAGLAAAYGYLGYMLFRLQSDETWRRLLLVAFVQMLCWRLSRDHWVYGVVSLLSFSMTVVINTFFSVLYPSPVLLYLFHELLDYELLLVCRKYLPRYRFSIQERGIMFWRLVVPKWFAVFSYLGLPLSLPLFLICKSTCMMDLHFDHALHCEIRCDVFRCFNYRWTSGLTGVAINLGGYWVLHQIPRPEVKALTLVIIQFFPILISSSVYNQKNREEQRREAEARNE